MAKRPFTQPIDLRSLSNEDILLTLFLWHTLKLIVIWSLKFFFFFLSTMPRLQILQ